MTTGDPSRPRPEASLKPADDARAASGTEPATGTGTAGETPAAAAIPVPRAATRPLDHGGPRRLVRPPVPPVTLPVVDEQAGSVARIEHAPDAPGIPPMPPVRSAAAPTPPIVSTVLDERGRVLAVSLGVFALALVVYWWVNQGHRADLDYYVPLANAFLHGRLDVAVHPPWLNELVPFGGSWYVVYPPMPAIVLAPFVVLFGQNLDQARVSILLGAVNAGLATWLIHRLGARGRSWVAFSVLFAFGTIVWFSAQAGSSWHFAHVVATLFLLLAIGDTLTGGPPWRAGLMLGFAGLARLPVLLAFPFFVAYVAWRAQSRPTVTSDSPALPTGYGALGSDEPTASLRALDRGRFLREFVQLGVGAAVPVLAYLAYNAARFGAPLENGYNLIPGLLDEYQYRNGFLSIHSIGRNLYALFLSTPNSVDAFPWMQARRLGGLSILLTTPAFVWAIRDRRPSWFTLGAWGAVALTLVPILLHADPGGSQFGYRYAIDVYPFLLLLMVRGSRGRIGFELAIAVAASIAVNAWGMWTQVTDWWA